MCKPWHGSFKITISFPEAAFLLMWRTSRPLARSNTGSPRFADYPVILRMPRVKSDWFWSQSIVFTSHSKPECRWTWPGVPISSAWQKGPLGTKLLKYLLNHFRVAPASISKRVLVHSLLYGNDYFLHVHWLVKKIHFHMKGFAPRVDLRSFSSIALRIPIAHNFTRHKRAH